MRIRKKKINIGKKIYEEPCNIIFTNIWDLTDKSVDVEMKYIIWEKTMSPVRSITLYSVIL
jgi:hypothetical protein